MPLNSWITTDLFEAVKNPYVSPCKVKYLVNKSANINAENDKGITILMNAIYHVYNHEVIAEILNAGANINAVDKNFHNALTIAAMNNPNPVIIRKLIQAGADINESDIFGRTILMLAAGYNNSFVLQEIIDSGANINAKNEEGRTALMFAAENCNAENAKILVKAGANVETRDKIGNNALSYAYKCNKRAQENYRHQYINEDSIISDTIELVNNDEALEFFRWLYEPFYKVDWQNISRNEILRLLDDIKIYNAGKYSCNVNEREYIYDYYRDKNTQPLQEAVENSSDIIIYTLVTSGLFDEDDFNEALEAAVSCDNYNAVSMLLKFGVDANYYVTYTAEDEYGYTYDAAIPLLMWAIKYPASDIEIINLLLNAGARIDECVFYYSDDMYRSMEITPLMLATDNLDIMQVLINHGADLNMQNNNGWTALMFAARMGCDVELLIKAGSKLNVKDKNGQTPLMLALNQINGCDFYDIHSSLYNEYSFRLYYSNDGISLEDLVNTLINHGADVNARDNFGRTPLIIAAQNADDKDDYYYNDDNEPSFMLEMLMELIDILILAGADINARDFYGKTALDYVRENNNDAIISILKGMI